MGYISLGRVQQDATAKVLQTTRAAWSSIELCRVEEVDVKNRVVSAYFFESRRVRKGVPYNYAFYNNGYGIMVVPTKGALGIVGWDAYQRPTILSFTAPSSVDETRMTTRNLPWTGDLNLPELSEGEILIESSGHSFVKFDRDGGVVLSSALFAYINLDENGNYHLDTEMSEVNANGISKEKYTENYEPVVEIIKGRHDYFSPKYLKNSVELCYRTTVYHGDEETGFFGIDLNGNIHYSGNLIKEELKCQTLMLKEKESFWSRLRLGISQLEERATESLKNCWTASSLITGLRRFLGKH